MERVLDDVYELNSTTPKIKTDKAHVAADLIFGLDSKLFKNEQEVKAEESLPGHHKEHYHDEVDLIEVHTRTVFNREQLDKALATLPKWDFYRIKGAIDLGGEWFILNFAFGRWEYIALQTPQEQTELILMGKNFKYHIRNLPAVLGISAADAAPVE